MRQVFRASSLLTHLPPLPGDNAVAPHPHGLRAIVEHSWACRVKWIVGRPLHMPRMLGRCLDSRR